MRKIKMKNLFLSFTLLFTLLGSAQVAPEINIKSSPNGIFDDIYDQYGNKYNLKDLKVGEDKIINNTLSKSTLICSSGMFDLYFETGCGMEDTSDTNENARRNVVCQVFSDLTNFINSPLKDPNNTTRVKIWIRNIANINGAPSNALGLATSFYTMPNNPAASFGGIVDGEVYKTIQGGKDSYRNTTAPLVNSDGSMNSSGIFYHGMMALNFNSVTWNTNLLTTAGTNQYDLYTVVLHEVTHALGFNSLLKQDGTSLFNNNYKYYTRYDRFLKNNSGNQFLITNSGACSSMYNYGFNNSLSTSILQPNASNCITNQTTCSNALMFVGTSTVPIYTPNCFEQGSSYSHFEDMCISNPNTGNDTYFVMSNANGSGTDYTKHFLTFEERNTLIDIGYSLKTAYGNNSIVINSQHNYNGIEVPLSNYINGLNDGISSTGTFSFINNANTTVPISGILDNDYNATSFECLQDVFDTTATLSITSGNSFNFNSGVSGLHLLRYVPINASGKKGNITYIYVYVRPNGTCATPNSCDLVMNGGFEQNYGTPNGAGGITLACGWSATNNASPDYFHTSGTNNTGIPCNFSGVQGSQNNSGNAYAGMGNWNQNGYQYSESIVTKLKSPLQPNTSYQLKLNASLADGCSSFANILQAYFSTTAIHPMPNSGDLPVTNSSMLFKNDPIYSRNTNSWDTIVFNFTTGAVAGEEYLYLGGIQNVQISANNPAANNQTCNYNNLNSSGWASYRMAYYYIDNVSLIQLNGATFNLPDPLCNNQILSNLETYLSSVPTNGVFTGPGVVNNAGIYSFNASTAGVGTHTITYIYTNNSGCVITISANITVVSSGIVPTFSPVAPICPGSTLSPLPTTSTNTVGITGTWSPALNNTTTTTYTFTPSTGQCATTTSLTITVLSASDPSCTTGVCQPNLTLSTPESASIVHKTINWIETNTNYTTSVGQDIKMKSGDFIYMKPGTYIKGGSLCLAKIETCTSTSKFNMEEPEYFEKKKVDGISIYPNPTNESVIVSAANSAIKSITISSIDGKTIYTNSAVNANSYLLNLSNYKNGVFIITIETVEGKTVRQKLIKN